MRNQKAFLLIPVLSALISSSNAQTINWGSLNEEYTHIVNANFGAEWGMIYRLGYGYHLHTELFEIVPVVEYSFPSGNEIFDDFKTKAGVHIRWVNIQNFQFSTRIQGIFRRGENDLVRLLNFGSDLAGVIGYYQPKWFVAGEAGFDKAVVTNFKHSQAYRHQYAGVVDGWYEPSTGGNFYFGAQVGYSFKAHDIYLKGGRIIAQDFETKPLMPFYFQLGYNFKML
jgi:hypothetical protein